MKAEDIKTIGVLGAGVMGGGISQSAILAGYNVVCRDLTDEILAKLKDTMMNGRFGFKGGIERGKQTQEQVDQAMARLKLTTKVEDLKDCDLVLEAIGGGDAGGLENKPLKLRVFTELDGIVKKEAIFASNTSFFTIADIAAVTQRKDRFLGMHFFSPANIMRLVEVTYTADVKEEVIQVAEEVCKKLGKTTVRVKDVPGDTGFIANRIFRALGEEARKVVEEGVASPQDVDTAMKLGFNWPAGPFELGAGARGGWG